MADVVGPLRRQAPVTPPAGRAGARAKQPQPRALRVGVYDPRTRERLRWAGQGLAAHHAWRHLLWAPVDHVIKRRFCASAAAIASGLPP